MIASFEIKGLLPRSNLATALIVTISHVISSLAAGQNILPATGAGGPGIEELLSNRHSRMSSSPLWPSSDVHWADVPSGLDSSDGWSRWGAKKHSKENKARVSDDGSITKKASHPSEYTAAEATERQHSEQIPSAFSHHTPYENLGSTSSNIFVSGQFDTLKQSLQQGKSQALFEFNGSKTGDNRSSLDVGAAEDIHHHFGAKEHNERKGGAPVSAFGQNFYTNFKSPNSDPATTAYEEDDNTGFRPSLPPSHHRAFGHEVHASFSNQIRNEREGTDAYNDSGSGINYNINHSNFGNSYFASTGADKSQPQVIDSHQHEARFDFGGFSGENTEVGLNHYSPEMLAKASKDQQPQHNFDFQQRDEEGKQQKYSQFYQYEEPDKVAGDVSRESHHTQRNGEFIAEEVDYAPVDYRNPIKKLEHAATTATAAESATNHHSLRLAAPSRGRTVTNNGHHHTSHDVHPHDGPYHFSEPPVEGTANEEYRRHAAEHTSYMTQEEQKELDEAFARLKERRRHNVNVGPSQPTRLNRDFSWF